MNMALLAIELLLLGLGMGIVALAIPKAIPLPATGRFAFGFATTPFLVASIILFFTVIWPGIPKVVLALAPVVLAVALLWHCRPLIAQLVRHRSHTQLRDPVFLILLVGVIWTAVLVAFRIIYFAQEPLGNSDALYYLLEAKRFATQRSFSAIAGMRGLEDGTLRGDQHGPLWVAWLASALVWNTNPGDLLENTIVRLPFGASFFFFFFSVVAVASALRTRYVILVSLLASVAVPMLYGTLTDGSRDSFRLAGLLLLSSFLLAHLRPNLRRVTSLSALIMSAALAAFAVQGHGLALVLVPIVVSTWGVVVLAARLPFQRLVIVGCTLGIGFVIGALHVVDATWRTGSLTGDNVLEWDQVKGTPYEGSVEERNKRRIGNGDDPIWRIALTVMRDRGWPSVGAFLVLIGGLGTLIHGAKTHFITIRQWRAITVSAWFLSYTLVVLGLFDFSRIQLGAWTILNSRYGMQWHMAAALVAAFGISLTLSRLRIRIPILAIVGALLLSLGTILLVVCTWPYYPTGVYQNVAATLKELVRPLPPSCRILSEEQGLPFYVEGQVVQIYSKYERDLLVARTPSELESLLAQQSFCVVVLYQGLYIDVAGPETPFARVLESKAFTRHDVLPWRIYVRSDP